MTPLSPQPTSLLTAGRGAFSPLALATRTHARTHARTYARTHPPGTCPSRRSISKGRSRLGVTCLRTWPASITPRRWRRCALPLTLLRRPVAEVGWSPASSCSRPSALRHLLRQAFTVFDQKAQDTGALTGNVSSRCAHHLPRSFLAPTRRHASAVPRSGLCRPR